MFPSPSSADSDRLRHLARHIPGAIYEFVQYPDGRMAFPYASEGLVQLCGISPAAVRDDASPLFAMIHAEDLARVMQSIQVSAAQFTPWHCEYRMYSPEGHQRWLQGDASPQRSPDGSIRWYGYVRDITAQKASQLALEASEHRLRRLIDTIDGLVLMIAPDLTLSFFSPMADTVSGQGLEALLHRPFTDIVHPEDLPYCVELVQACLGGESSRSVEFRALHQNGHYYWYAANLSPFVAEAEAPISCLGIATYIDDRKRAELALQESETRFQALVANVPGMVYRYVPNGDGGVFTYVSPGCSELFGLAPEQVLEDINQVWALIHPEDLPSLQASVALAVEQGTDWSGESRFITSTGQLRWFQGRSRPQMTASGLVWDGLLIDITALKQTEAALSQEVGYRRALFEASGDGIVVLNSAGQVVEANHSFAAMLGYGLDELTNLNVADFDADLALMQDKLEPTPLYLDRFERRHRRRDGSTYAVEICVSAVQWNGASVRLCVCRDIEQRQRAEMALAASEDRFRAIFEQAAVGINRADASGRFIEANQYFCDLLGYTRDELLNLTFQTITHPEDLHQDPIAGLFAGEQTSITIEKRYRHKQGEWIWTEVTLSVIYDAAGRAISDLAIVLDIRDFKQASAALQASEVRFQAIFDQVAAGINQIDAAGRFVEANPYYCRLLGYSRAELLELTYADVIHPEDLARHQVQIDRILRGEIDSVDYEKRDRHRDGHWIWTKISISVLRDEAGQVVGNLAVVIDIRDRKRYETALQDAQQLLQTVLDTVPMAIFWKNRQSIILGCNQQFVQVSGLTDPADVIGKSHFELGYTAAEVQTYTHDDRQVMASGIPKIGIQETITSASGEQRWVETNKLPLRDWAGQIIGVVGTFQDITDRKQAEQTIRQQAARETLLREITQRIRQSLDLPTIFNTACQEIRTTLHADRVGIFKFSPNAAAGEGEFVAEACLGGVPSVLGTSRFAHGFGAHYTALCAQGDYVVIHDVHNANMASGYTDVLAQFQVQASLVLPLLCGDTLWGLLCIHQCRGPRQWLQSEIELGHQLANQLAIALQQVTTFEQLQQELGERQRAQQQLSDRNRELAIANQDLSRATRLKDEFLANMSHELRTPLNVILGFGQILSGDPSLQAQQQEYIRIMQRSGDHLLHLINDILDLSKIAANRITLEPESINLFSLLHDLQAMFQERAEDKELGFSLTLAPNLPQYVVVDPNKLRQVLINLLGNAVKFTQAGRIALRVSLLNLEDCVGNAGPGQGASALGAGPNSPLAHLSFAVEDTGSGIAPEELTAIFDAFTQAKAGKVSLEGTGLGLAISRSLVHLMGGELSVDSTLGEGSTFQFTLPLRLAQAAEVTTVDHLNAVTGLAPGQPTYRVLVVDDQPENRYFLVAALSRLGLVVQEATNGTEAIARWRQWHPHLIWMDLRMPEIDGCEATRRIRAEFQALGETPEPVIIALTAQASYDQYNQALAAGCDDFVSKPVQLRVLLTKMAEHLSLRYCYSDQGAKGLPAPPHPPRLEPGALRVMPPDWVSALHQASVLCDSTAVAQLLDQIPPEHQSLLDSLTQLTQEFKFEVLMQLTSPAAKC
ncbi:PAS domain S-box protein [Leptolyngbya sp. KIOST-1]|uniref:PAS domain S-box protein n=1 Tax=Leptolyngbya sp. KIOST-1 TaxID=1229172 RepID=UPI000564E975|nr:PAS domain S-box protein [Leptolyngbya sp. KIOST-1]